MIVVTDSQGIRGYDLSTASTSLEVRPGGRVSGVVSEEGRLVVAGEKEVKVYDPRKDCGAPVMTLRDSRAKHYNCLTARADLVVAGTEQIKDESFLVFWDLRQSGKLMGGYWETFNDDITSLSFRPGPGETLATGCTDGLVNILDLSEGDEDEALLTSHNTQDSVASVVWYSTSKTGDNLAIQTHTESVQLWRTEDVTARHVLSREQVCHGIRRTCPDFTYIVGLHPHTTDGLTVLAGSRCEVSPCVRLARIRNRKVKPLSLLEGARGLVTCSLALTDSCFVTGDEDGQLWVWREEQADGRQHDNKVLSKISKARDKPY